MTSSQPILVDIGEGLSLMVGLPTIGSWETRNRPKKAKPGTFGFNIQTNKLEFYDGLNWYEGSMSKT